MRLEAPGIETEILFLSGRPQKKIAVPARAGSDGNSPAEGVPNKIFQKLKAN